MEDIRLAREENLLNLYEELSQCADKERDSITRAIQTIEKAIADDESLRVREYETLTKVELDEKQTRFQLALQEKKADLEKEIQKSKSKQDNINNAVNVGVKVAGVGASAFLLANMMKFESTGCFTSKLFNIIVKPISRIL